MSDAQPPTTQPIAHQGTCVMIGTQGLLIEGPPGAGKSSLALALIDRGATLVGDDGVLIEAMGKRGLEMIVGAKNDPEWGPVVLAGFGGVTAEILQDVRLLTADLTEEAVVAELMKLKSAALLKGYRGSPALDVDALARLIVTVGQVLRAEPSIREIDLNPVILHPVGEGVVALDALMLVD